MEKTKLGISAGLFAAFVYVAAASGGYIAAIVLAGYVLLAEPNEWLKRTVIKALAVMACFSFASLLINLIPDAFDVIQSLVRLFDKTISISFVDRLFNLFNTALTFLKYLAYVVLTYKALTYGTVNIPVVDKLIEKYKLPFSEED